MLHNLGEESNESFWEVMSMIAGGRSFGCKEGILTLLRFSEERTDCRVISREIEEFSKFIDHKCLIDLPSTRESGWKGLLGKRMCGKQCKLCG